MLLFRLHGKDSYHRHDCRAILRWSREAFTPKLNRKPGAPSEICRYRNSGGRLGGGVGVSAISATNTWGYHDVAQKLPQYSGEARQKVLLIQAPSKAHQADREGLAKATRAHRHAKLSPRPGIEPLARAPDPASKPSRTQHAGNGPLAAKGMDSGEFYSPSRTGKALPSFLTSPPFAPQSHT